MYSVESLMRRCEQKKFHSIRKIEVFIQSVLCLQIMDKVLASFIDQFSSQVNEYLLEREETQMLNIGKKCLQDINSFIENLFGILFDSLYSDCKMVALAFNFKPECITYLSYQNDVVETTTNTAADSPMEVPSPTNPSKNSLSTDITFDEFFGADPGDYDEKNLRKILDTIDEGYEDDKDSSDDESIHEEDDELMRMDDETLSKVLESGDDFGTKASEILRRIRNGVSYQSEVDFLRTDKCGEYDRDEWVRSSAEDELKAIVRIAVRRQIEMEAYIGTFRCIHYTLHENSFCSLNFSPLSITGCRRCLKQALLRGFGDRHSIIKYNLSCLRNKPQTFFGIPVEHISPSSWESVVIALRKIEDKSIPYDRIMALLKAAHEIPDLYKLEHVGSENALGADDFLPIFIYVVVRAQIKDIALINEEMQALCDPDGRMSEAGYYLATLEASIQHISDIDINTGELQEGVYADESDDDDDDDDDDQDFRGRVHSVNRNAIISRDDDDDDDDDNYDQDLKGRVHSVNRNAILSRDDDDDDDDDVYDVCVDRSFTLEEEEEDVTATTTSTPM